jgi:hypothetical protein
MGWAVVHLRSRYGLTEAELELGKGLLTTWSAGRVNEEPLGQVTP